MDSSIISVVLPVVLAVVMFGLGLSLTVADFARVLTAPRAVLVTLVCQMIVLPLIVFGLVVAFGIGPDLAIGMMVLVVSPGGATANVFSHLARADVALNVTVTAVNSVLAMITLPFVVVFSVRFFAGSEASIGLQLDKLVQVVAIVLVPVALGMLVRWRWPGFAERMERPVRIAAVVAVFLAIIAAILQQLDQFLDGLVAIGLLCLLVSVLSLTVGYTVPRLARIDHRQAVAAAMEIGIHNAVLAITVLVTVLDNPAAALAPAMYGVLMYIPAAIFVRLVMRGRVPTGTPIHRS
ncbi:MAG: bile acid:sodium symporter family protein [Pseudonocardia sp.]|uniref:bile acid:sodium symporter family protein n=1 Tax=unclassified Pseudonocardia TaxID=2619320 RepID=UPI00086E9F67|nr:MULTISPECIES: bile acid:sodium symporter family protein [unclassified Pseudonocardia]MBN9112278.1 bile acid:sodium symporter family protein [Pseudonocardia sp.]ODU99804.1 MAG: bile acid:sodium symporter [Pseudonocardia sp. SCN 73-27]